MLWLLLLLICGAESSKPWPDGIDSNDGYIYANDEGIKPDSVINYVVKLEQEAKDGPDDTQDPADDWSDNNLDLNIETGIEEAVELFGGPEYHIVDSAPIISDAPATAEGFTVDQSYNEVVDGLLINMSDEMALIHLDPIYFRMRNTTKIVPNRKRQQAEIEKRKNNNQKPPEVVSTTTRKPRRSQSSGRLERIENKPKNLGGGVVRGLRDIQRKGDAHTKRDKTSLLVRSDLSIGPVMLELNIRKSNAALRRQEQRGRKKKTTRQVRVTSGLLSGTLVAEVETGNSKLMHFTIHPPDLEETEVKTRRNKRANRRLENIGKKIIGTILHKDSFIMKEIKKVARRAAAKRYVWV